MAGVLRIGGLPAEIVESPSEIPKVLTSRQERPSIFVSMDHLVDVLSICRDHPTTDVFTILSETNPSVFGSAAKVPQMMGVIGLRDDENVRPWELLQVARRLSLGKPPPPAAPLAWGHSWVEKKLAGSKDREALIEDVHAFCAEFQSRRQASATSQVVDELMMNAMYDAPVDAKGRERYAHKRNQAVELDSEERPTFGYGTDGTRIVLSITDPFGRLPKGAVFGGIHRGLTSGEMDTRGGGAGLGMLLIYHAAKVLFFDVIPGQRTQVTAVVELDLPPVDFRKLPGSVHFFVHRPQV